MATPSIKQALNRMNTGHERVLEAFSRGDRVDASGVSAIGIRRCHRTLLNWGAVESGRLTDFGRDLFAAVVSRNSKAGAA